MPIQVFKLQLAEFKLAGIPSWLEFKLELASLAEFTFSYAEVLMARMANIVVCIV